MPGHPELRHTIAIYNLYKIGLSDEKTTMKCLLDLSTIDPLRRNPAWFYTVDPETRRKTIDKLELKKFCQEYPRLVRRLREGLDHASEERIVEFLEKNGDVPSRFVDVDKSQWSPRPPAERGQTKLKEPTAQFPVLPPHIKPDMPDRKGMARHDERELHTSSPDRPGPAGVCVRAAPSNRMFGDQERVRRRTPAAALRRR